MQHLFVRFVGEQIVLRNTSRYRKLMPNIEIIEISVSSPFLPSEYR